MSMSFKQTLSRAGARLLLAATMMTLLSAQAAEPSKLSDNKATVVAFYEKALNDKDAEAAIGMMGPTYTQHTRVRHQVTQVIDLYRGGFKTATTAGTSGGLGWAS